MNMVDVVLVLVIVLCYVFAFSHRSRRWIAERPGIATMEKGVAGWMSKYYSLLLLIIVLIAVTVRIWRFGMIPFGFNQDEAMAGLEALSLAQNGTDHYGMRYPVYFTAWGSHQMNVLLSYTLVPLFRLFGPSVVVARLPLLLFSLISLYVVYRFAYKSFGHNAALVMLFIVAINPWQIMSSRWALEANLLPHLLLYGCYWIYLGLEKKAYVYGSMIFFGLAMYAYGIAYYLVPLLLVSLCVYLLYRKAVQWYDVVICFLIYGAISWPLFVMMILNVFHLDTVELSIMTIPFFEKGERLNDVLFFSNNIWKQLGENFLYIILFVFLQTKDRPWNSIPAIGPFYFVAIPLLILGLAFFVNELRRREPKEKDGFVLLILWFGASFVSGLITNHVNLNRMNAIAYPVLFMVGYGLFQIVKHLKITIVPITLVFAFLFGHFCHAYFYGDFSKQLGKEFYKGFVESMQYVKETDYDTLCVTAKTQGDNAAFSSEILTQFLLELDSQYTSGKALPKGETRPYKEKYRYGISKEDIELDNMGTIYIVRQDELVYFDPAIFEFVAFEEYYVVTPRG